MNTKIDSHSIDPATRVVLTGDGEWHGTFAELFRINDTFTPTEIQEAAEALARQGWHVFNMGAGGLFMLRVESEAERELMAALSEAVTWCATYERQSGGGEIIAASLAQARAAIAKAKGGAK